MSRRNEATEALKPQSAKQVTLASGFAWHEIAGVGKVGVTVEQSGARKLTAQPIGGRTHQIAEAFVFRALDAGDMDDRADDGTLLSGWVTLTEDGYVLADGTVIAPIPDELENEQDDEDEEPTA